MMLIIIKYYQTFLYNEQRFSPINHCYLKAQRLCHIQLKIISACLN